MGKIFASIKKLLTKLLMIIAIVLFVLAALVSGGIVLVPFLGATLLPYIGLALGAIALAFVIDSKEAKKVLGKVFEVVDSVVDGISKVTSNAIGSIFKNNWWWLFPAGAIGLWYITRDGGSSFRETSESSLRERQSAYGNYTAEKNDKEGNLEDDY